MRSSFPPSALVDDDFDEVSMAILRRPFIRLLDSLAILHDLPLEEMRDAIIASKQSPGRNDILLLITAAQAARDILPCQCKGTHHSPMMRPEAVK